MTQFARALETKSFRPWKLCCGEGWEFCCRYKCRLVEYTVPTNYKHWSSGVTCTSVSTYIYPKDPGQQIPFKSLSLLLTACSGGGGGTSGGVLTYTTGPHEKRPCSNRPKTYNHLLGSNLIIHVLNLSRMRNFLVDEGGVRTYLRALRRTC